MLKAIDVANFFIYLNKKNNDLTYEKLNYLIYLSYGWYLVKNDVVLFDEEIYADFEYGIKINSIYNAFKNKTTLDYHSDFDISIFVSTEIELLIAMYDYYYELNINELRQIIFAKNNPRYYAFNHLDKKISNDDILGFFNKRKYFDDLK